MSRSIQPPSVLLPVSTETHYEPSPLALLVIWVALLMLISVAGAFFIRGMSELGAQSERAVQRQYDLMKVEEQAALDGARRSLGREGLRAEGGKQ